MPQQKRYDPEFLLRQNHEKMTPKRLTPTLQIYSAILYLYSVTWKFSSLVRKLEHRAIDNQIAQVILEKIWEDHNDALRILVSELQASPDRNQDARRFCEV